MKFTRDEVQWMSEHGWELQPDDETFRDRSVRNTKWITKYNDAEWFAFEVQQTGESTYEEYVLTETFGSPMAVVVYLEVEQSNERSS